MHMLGRFGVSPRSIKRRLKERKKSPFASERKTWTCIEGFFPSDSVLDSMGLKRFREKKGGGLIKERSHQIEGTEISGKCEISSGEGREYCGGAAERWFPQRERLSDIC